MDQIKNNRAKEMEEIRKQQEINKISRKSKIISKRLAEVAINSNNISENNNKKQKYDLHKNKNEKNNNEDLKLPPP